MPVRPGKLHDAEWNAGIALHRPRFRLFISSIKNFIGTSHYYPDIMALLWKYAILKVTGSLIHGLDTKNKDIGNQNEKPACSLPVIA